MRSPPTRGCWARCGPLARARENAWAAGAAPERIVIDIDATLITAHSEKDGAAGTFN